MSLWGWVSGCAWRCLCVNVRGIYFFQKVLISSLPILPHCQISSPFHAHIFIVPSLISSPISILAELFPYPKKARNLQEYIPLVNVGIGVCVCKASMMRSFYFLIKVYALFLFLDVSGLFDKIPCFFIKSHFHEW